MTVTQPIEPRFWRFVEKRADGCWMWVGSTNEHGYGQISVNSKPVKAHRVSWQMHTGQVLTAAQKVLHQCDNPPCVNPAHLYVGTQADNVRDMVERGRCNPRRAEACLHGHPLSGENLFLDSRGRRGCRECRRAATRRWKSRRKAAVA